MPVMHQPLIEADRIVVDILDVEVVDGGRGVFGLDRLDGRRSNEV